MSEITKEQYQALFLEMNPGYFERDYVKAIPKDEPASEILFIGDEKKDEETARNAGCGFEYIEDYLKQ